MGEAGEELRVVAAVAKELEQILQFPGAFALEESLRVPSRLGVPFQHGLLVA